MKPETRQILSAYQHLMRPHERMTARWLTEEWDGESGKVPSWLTSRVFVHFPDHLLRGDPNDLARFILLRVLQDHREEIGRGQRPASAP